MVFGFRMGLPAATCVLLAAMLAGCASEDDHRLTDDQQTCQNMGHAPGTLAFDQCKVQLDERRCATMAMKGGSMHVANEACTKLN